MADCRVIPAMMWGLTCDMCSCFFLLLEELATTKPLVSTFTGAPSFSASPANLSSKTSHISMLSLKKEGTLYNIDGHPAYQ